MYQANLFMGLKDYLVDYLDAQGWLTLVIDLIFVLATLGCLAYFMFKYLNRKFVLYSIVTIVVLYSITLFLGLVIFKDILTLGIFLYAIIVLIYYAPNIRQVIEGVARVRNNKSFITNEETREELINTLIRACEFLASRKIGAIITIEKEDSLTAYFAKGTMLDSEISYELLLTIFMQGTHLHDGAVVIRGNRLMCAGVFYQPSDRNDLEKRLGSRHRAALGIAEDSDSFTIVVSEERGSIAVAVDGQLTTGVTIEGLRTFLKQNIIIK